MVKMKFCNFWPHLQNYFWPTPGHKCRSRQIFGHAKDFSPKSPKLARKVLCDFCQQIFSHKEPFWRDLQKQDSCVFLQTLGPIFAQIFRDFIWISTNQNFWGFAFTPCNPPLTPLVLENPLLALAWKTILPAPMFRGTYSSTEMLKRYMARESLGTPGLARHWS